MSLTSGTRLGPYEIIAPLGAGGMGEVYKARDRRLNRLIALKLLPAGAAGDAERRERFEREAQAIAALNHPHIVTIHSVEEADGQFFLTMELVEGRSLAHAMPAAGMPLERFLKIAIPVADAVAAAHLKGITHRDLKPANIMLGEGEHEGRVKVLDFGLAKLAEAPATLIGATTLPTAPITGEGRILGTVAYMSPEQAEGKSIDARSDLFSLGVMFYEMATGRRPFAGDTSISIISSIIKDTPKSITDLNPVLPRDLGRIVRRALVKDPTRRYQTAADLRNDLEELKASLDSGELVAAPAPSASVHRRQAQAWWWVAVGIGLVAIIVLVLDRLPRRAEQPQAGAAPHIRMQALTSTGNASRAVLSPDGKYVVYIQEDDNQSSVWVRQISGSGAVRIVPPEPKARVLSLAVTPDGSSVDFVKFADGELSFALWRVPFLGGAPRKIVDDVESAPGWSPDGKQMAFLRNRLVPPPAVRSVIVADADGANARVLAARTAPKTYVVLSTTSRPDARPIWMPDGQSIVVAGSDRGGQSYEHLVAINVNTGAETVLADNFNRGSPDAPGWSVALAADEHSFIASVPVDETEPQQVVRIQAPGGRITKLTSDLNQYAGVSLVGDTLVTVRWQTHSGLWTMDADGSDTRAIGTDVAAALGPLAWADGTRVVYEASLAGGTGLWLHDLATGVAQLIVPGGMQPSTTADGRTIVFNRMRDGKVDLWRADSNGTHAALVLRAASGIPAVTPDGTRVLFISTQSGIQSPWIVDIDGANSHELLQMPSNPDPRVSPDGRFVAFVSLVTETGLLEVVIAPIAGGDPPRRVRIGTPRRLGWTPEGLGLTYLDPSQTNIWVQPIAGGMPRQLTHFTDRRIVGYAWSHDGRRLALSRATTTSDVVMLKGVK